MTLTSLFCMGKLFKYDGEAERQVCWTDDKIIFEASVLSRKVMLFARNSNDDVQENDLIDGQ